LSGALWTGDGPGIELAAAALAVGGVIGFPTDTVFGLACSATSPEAITRLCEIKFRSPTQPLILMAASWQEMDAFVTWPPTAAGLIQRFWPGPLTIIVGARPKGTALGGGDTVGVRTPAHPTALALLRRSGPLATSSANRHGGESAVDAGSALRLLPGLAGALAANEREPSTATPSSILDLTRDQPVLIREGRLSARELGVPVPEQEPGIRRD
jgi:L-threonylcarbamoyladenylate synthase